MQKVLQKGIAASRAAAAVPGVPDKWQRVYRPSDTKVRKVQWNALTRREKMKATFEYYLKGKKFIGLDFSGNKYFELVDGERVVEWPSSRERWDIKETIPIVWKLWLQNPGIQHPPHPEEVINLETEDAQKQRKVQEKLEQADAAQRMKDQAAAPPILTGEELDQYDLKEQAGKMVKGGRSTVAPMPGGSGKPYVAPKQDWDNP